MSGAVKALEVRETANRLRMAIGAFRRRAREVPGEGELSSPQLTALARLDELGPITTAGLARREQITPQAMGTTIASLEKFGMVARAADDGDGRRSILTLTPKGVAAIRSGRNALSDRITVVIEESFDEEEAETLAAAAHLIERLAHLL
jgi:DNA-binding MarR family transcriptional regulator